MRYSKIETATGFLVLAIAGIFVIFALMRTGESLSSSACYQIAAEFDDVNGIATGSNVMIAGIKIGSVKDIKLNNHDFTATLIMSIDSDVSLPKDSLFAVVSSGIIGAKFINVTPGIHEIMLLDGDVAIRTKSSMNLEGLIDRLINFFVNKKS